FLRKGCASWHARRTGGPSSGPTCTPLPQALAGEKCGVDDDRRCAEALHKRHKRCLPLLKPHAGIGCIRANGYAWEPSLAKEHCNVPLYLIEPKGPTTALACYRTVVFFRTSRTLSRLSWTPVWRAKMGARS